jgi:hypothetical protein
MGKLFLDIPAGHNDWSVFWINFAEMKLGMIVTQVTHRV